jgi:hypothetical protein
MHKVKVEAGETIVIEANGYNKKKRFDDELAEAFGYSKVDDKQ